MPIHLHPTSRRQFLKQTLAVGAAAVLPRPLLTFAADTEIDPHTVALLADTHVGSSTEATRGKMNMAANFVRVAKELAALDVRPAFAVIGGDCALSAGLPAEYRTLAALLPAITRLRIPLHLVMGNHDDRKAFYRVLKAHRPAKPLVTGKHAAIVEAERANFFLLDSLDVVNKTPGRLGEEQLAWLAKALDARTEKPAIVMSHHQPELPLPKPGEKIRKGNGVQDTAALMKLLTPRRHVKAYLNGHRHRWGRTTHEGIHVIDIPATAYAFGKTTPTGWTVARLLPGGIALRLQSSDGKHKDHDRKIELKWRS